MTEALMFGHPSSLCAYTRAPYSTLCLRNDDVQADCVEVYQRDDRMHGPLPTTDLLGDHATSRDFVIEQLFRYFDEEVDCICRMVCDRR